MLGRIREVVNRCILIIPYHHQRYAVLFISGLLSVLGSGFGYHKVGYPKTQHPREEPDLEIPKPGPEKWYPKPNPTTITNMRVVLHLDEHEWMIHDCDICTTLVVICSKMKLEIIKPKIDQCCTRFIFKRVRLRRSFYTLLCSLLLTALIKITTIYATWLLSDKIYAYL